MATPINPDNDSTGTRPLPPELAFLKNVPNLKEMDDDELRAWMANHIALIRQNAALLRERGTDPEMMIASLQSTFAVFDQAAKEADAALETQYQALADLGDAQYNLFKAMEAVVNPAYENAPFDPEVQEAKEFLEEWRKHMPKE
jgi:hypothetical protein